MVAVLAISGSALVGIAVNEGFSPTAYTPIKGDKETIGFGETHNVKPGQTVTVTRALQDLLGTEKAMEKQVKKCIKVPVYQYEFDAYMDFAYNVGPQAFCGSTLVAKLNREEYVDACKELLRWDQFKGHYNAGLHTRRLKEYLTCMGEKQ